MEAANFGRCIQRADAPQGDSADGEGEATENEYEDIPGTFVFNAERSRQGYGINMFCMSLMKDENRKAFKANEAEYLKKYQLTPEQTDASSSATTTACSSSAATSISPPSSARPTGTRSATSPR